MIVLEILIIALLTAVAVINAAGLVIIVGHMADHKPVGNHTSNTIACFEDAIAVGNDIETFYDIEIIHHESEANKLRAAKERHRQQLDILRTGRTSPHSYDPDRPAGKRPKGWR